MPYVISGRCTRARTCVELCPAECIVLGPDSDPEWGMASWVDPECCIECGVCAAECPEEAIFPDDEVPEEFTSWIAKNAAFYAEGPGASAN
jgi:ferredoxin